MKARLIVTDDEGNTFESQFELKKVGRGKASSKSSRAPASPGNATGPPSLPTFSGNVRGFIKTYRRRGMSGAEAFALLLAYMTKGASSQEIKLSEVEKQWGKLKSLLGEFNRAHTTRAKENGWVDSPKQGIYVLLPAWKEVLRGK